MENLGRLHLIHRSVKEYSCRECSSKIEKGKEYFKQNVYSDNGFPHVSQVCVKCGKILEKRGSVVVDDKELRKEKLKLKEFLDQQKLVDPRVFELIKKYNFPVQDFLVRADGRIEWTCEHGVGHTIAIPEGVEGFAESAWWTHSCDSCCQKLKEIKNA